MKLLFIKLKHIGDARVPSGATKNGSVIWILICDFLDFEGKWDLVFVIPLRVSNLSIPNRVIVTERTQRHDHAGPIIWFPGLSGAGKSTFAGALERKLFDQGRQVYVLDGDWMRKGLCSDLGFSPAERSENIRRVGEVAMLFASAGVIVICACISPMRADRERLRHLCAPGRFVEVFVNAPLDVCECRDLKGLYAKARANQLKDCTGISSPYEPPLHPEVEVRTDKFGIEECLARLSAVIEARLRTN
jgi:adenylyl-sulfate kinase